MCNFYILCIIIKHLYFLYNSGFSIIHIFIYIIINKNVICVYYINIFIILGIKTVDIHKAKLKHLSRIFLFHRNTFKTV